MTILYEIEIQRNNINPRQFFTYCKREMKRRTGVNLDSWCESFEDWASEKNEYNVASNHEDWDVPQKEIFCQKSFDWHLFLSRTYNFIMEFQFYEENKGFGYLYVVEFEN